MVYYFIKKKKNSKMNQSTLTDMQLNTCSHITIRYIPVHACTYDILYTYDIFVVEIHFRLDRRKAELPVKMYTYIVCMRR